MDLENATSPVPSSDSSVSAVKRYKSSNNKKSSSEKLFVKLKRTNGSFSLSNISSSPALPENHQSMPVLVSKTKKASQIHVSNDNLTVTGSQGYSMCLSTHGALRGSWFCEITINDTNGACRLGWSTELGDIQAPCGYDRYSYSYRSIGGDTFHQSYGSPYGESYGPGDVIGCYIDLPPGHTNSVMQHTEILPNSLIRFFKNGIDQGVAISPLFKGTYHPAASLFNHASVTFNFGEKEFSFPPLGDWQPICKLGSVESNDITISIVEQAPKLSKDTNESTQTVSESTPDVHIEENSKPDHIEVETTEI